METNGSIYTIPEHLFLLYKNMEISPLTVLNNYANAHIQSKIQKYEAENNYYTNKYGLAFEDFKHKIESNELKEDFSCEDDLLDWQFAIENIIYWNKQLAGLIT